MGDGPIDRGLTRGQDGVILTQAQLPAHTHPHPQAVIGITSTVGGGQPFDNWQPSLFVNWAIETAGNFPSREVQVDYGFRSGVVSRMIPLAGDPTNFPSRSSADGQVLEIRQNSALFSLIGLTYGGNGRLNFALPDLRSRAARSSEVSSMGAFAGKSDVTLTVAQLPDHVHSVSGA